MKFTTALRSAAANGLHGMLLICIGFFLSGGQLLAQEEEVLSSQQEEQMESNAEQAEENPADDTWWQQLAAYRKHRLNLNTAGARDLAALHLLSDWQVLGFLRYRALFGKLISVYELQAVPGWDSGVIRQLLPYIMVSDQPDGSVPFLHRWKGGQVSWLARYSGKPGKADTDQGYIGDNMYLQTRFRYQYQQLLQIGFTAEKDAGEPFFRSPGTYGFDFYSGHLFVRQAGIVRALALGDFTVNLGQGLVHWQSLAFKKSAAVLSVKRQSPVLKPYQGTGEFNFQRGAGLTLAKGPWETTVFISSRKLSAHLEADPAGGVQPVITSLLPSGYHRSQTEAANRFNTGLFTTGGNLQYQGAGWQAGVSTVHYQFSHPLQPADKPYNRYSLTGTNSHFYSADFSITLRNLHGYGELGIDNRWNKALLIGWLMSLERRVALTLVYRQIDSRWQSLMGNAFTEQRLPENEIGLYTGLQLRLAANWQLDAYADSFRFPWLQFRTDAPGYGSEYLVQLTHRPGRRVEMIVRYRIEQKPLNFPGNSGHISDHGPAGMPVGVARRQQCRMQVVLQVNPRCRLRQRVELIWYQGPGMRSKERGFSAFTDASVRITRSFTVDARWFYFDTDSYQSRLYAFEADLSSGFSMPVFFNKGTRYYVHLRYNMPVSLLSGTVKKYMLQIGLRLAGVVQGPSGREKMGEAPEIPTLPVREWGVQLVLRGK